MRATGGPEALEPVELPDPEPGPDDVLVSVAAAGVNFMDVYRRAGLYPVQLPSVPGVEIAGRVVAVGADVHEFAIGDLVATADAEGGYAELVAVPQERVVRVPDGVWPEQAAGVLLQGMTAHYLVNDTFALSAGHRCLVHAAAGGVGLLLVQLAKQVGAEVFATVGTAEKGELAKAAGADHVIITGNEDFVAAIERIAGPRAVDVVYDGVGKQTFAGGLDVLRRRGTMVTFGNASGPPDPISPLTLMAKGSLYLTRPTLADYVAGAEELRRRALDVLALVAEGRLDVRIGARFPVAEAAAAHRLLEGRGTTGKVVLVP
ncbi:MAG TPA: quinone oxidoreductase [Kineosporiaceae bacterium]|nr:quinone oxidoreductase [Kineosporiaceae bacterium]